MFIDARSCDEGTDEYLVCCYAVDLNDYAISKIEDCLDRYGHFKEDRGFILGLQEAARHIFEHMSPYDTLYIKKGSFENAKEFINFLIDYDVNILSKGKEVAYENNNC